MTAFALVISFWLAVTLNLVNNEISQFSYVFSSCCTPRLLVMILATC